MLQMTKEQYLAKVNDWLDTSPDNGYDEVVVANQITDVDNGKTLFRCREDQWQEAHRAWSQAIRSIDPDYLLPQPMSTGHSMFVRPHQYACVKLGETVLRKIRRAHRCRIVNNLRGWDRDMRQSWTGLRQLAKIVRASVDAAMSGQSVGAAPYLACIMASV